MIELTKKYRTRDWREVIIHTITAPGGKPVIGSVNCAGGWEPRSWTDKGRFTTEGPDCHADLIEVVPLWEGDIWVHPTHSPIAAHGSNNPEIWIRQGWRKITVIEKEAI